MSHAQPPIAGNEQGIEVLTRGPVHEAFAGIVPFNPEPGIVAPKAPPDPIEELPPDERPSGDNVSWIPGYWSWDDERNDFIWVSGVWRALPPGRQWITGYWVQSPQGYQWVSGYWADARVNETRYLPPPPATVEAGPNIAAPSADYGWTPGCWIWYQNRYAWRPGYWEVGYSNWTWCPAYYAWTPRGYVFVDGYWDYPVAYRGMLFAPVCFDSPIYARRGYRYSPSIVINLNVFSDHLFVRPRYHHYYFGDYYAASYASAGFYVSFSFQSQRYGYDPIHAHQRWKHRHDREWERREETTYQYRRDHENARPPRTWAAQRNIRTDAQSGETSHVMAMPLDQVSKRKDHPVRLQPVARREKQQIIERDQDVQKFRQERRTVEATAAETPAPAPRMHQRPPQVMLPKSPIAAKPTGLPGMGHSPPRPQRVPTPDLTVEPGPVTTSPRQNRNRTDRPSEILTPKDQRKSDHTGKEKQDENDDNDKNSNK